MGLGFGQIYSDSVVRRWQKSFRNLEKALAPQATAKAARQVRGNVGSLGFVEFLSDLCNGGFGASLICGHWFVCCSASAKAILVRLAALCLNDFTVFEA
jgi:hypothetical protein